MRTFLPVLVLSALALSTVGCVDETSGAGHGTLRRGTRVVDTAGGDAESEPKTTKAVAVKGTVDNVDATTVDVYAMDAKGDLTEVGSADVKDGEFETELPANASATEVFILKAKNLGGSVVNSGLVNGLPAFINGFLVDVPMDAVTTYKAEVLQVMAKKGTPGVQNYINVLNAYVDGNLAGVIAVDSVLTNDSIEVVGATADAIIAAEEVIEETLKKAGIPVDFDKLQAAQAMTASGIQGFLLDASNKRISNAKNLVSGFETALANGAKPIDDAIFNAVVNGGGAFGSKMKEKAPANAFAAQKSAFKLGSLLASSKMTSAFEGTDLADAVKEAVSQFTSSVGKAKSAGDLESAKDTLLGTILGEDKQATLGPLQQIVQTLTKAIQSFDPAKVMELLKAIDLEEIRLPADLTSAMGKADPDAVKTAIRLVQKQVAP